MASESALTATASAVGPRRPRRRVPRRRRPRALDLAGEPQHPSPAAVGRACRLRTSSTRPTAVSSALIRWLTADGVTCSVAAAASNVPSLDDRAQRTELVQVDSISSNSNASKNH